jgi:Fe-S cluster assembly scaffold protein SufB
MIDDEKLDYLKSLGMDEDSARDLIVRGFLNLEDSRIPASVRDRVTELVSAARGAERM